MPDNNLHSINKLQDDIKAAKWLSVFLPKEKRQQIKELETSFRTKLAFEQRIIFIIPFGTSLPELVVTVECFSEFRCCDKRSIFSELHYRRIRFKAKCGFQRFTNEGIRANSIIHRCTNFQKTKRM